MLCSSLTQENKKKSQKVLWPSPTTTLKLHPSFLLNCSLILRPSILPLFLPLFLPLTFYPSSYCSVNGPASNKQRSKHHSHVHNRTAVFFKNSPIHRQATKSNAKARINNVGNDACQECKHIPPSPLFFFISRTRQKQTTKCRGHGTIFQNERERRRGGGEERKIEARCFHLEGQQQKRGSRQFPVFQFGEEEVEEHMDQNKQTNKHPFHFREGTYGMSNCQQANAIRFILHSCP